MQIISERCRSGITYAVASNVQELVETADILCTLTSSANPVVATRDLAARSSEKPLIVLAVGACTAGTRELSHGLVTRARLPFVVDTLDGAMREAGDLLAPDVPTTLNCDATSVKNCMLPLSAVVASDFAYTPTQSGNCIIYKSVGFGAQDLALAIEAFHASKRS